jgi:hypothetical protein
VTKQERVVALPSQSEGLVDPWFGAEAVTRFALRLSSAACLDWPGRRHQLAAVIARLIAARRPARVLAESRADGKGAALRHRQGDFSGLPFRRSR